MVALTIVVVTYNSMQCIKDCLASVVSQAGEDIEIIVVDNNSKDGTAGYIATVSPKIHAIENKQNRGVAMARNQAIAIAQGKWVFTLDCDVVLDKDFLPFLLRSLHTLPSGVGMVQPKILYPDGKTIYSCGIHFSHLRRFHDIGKGSVDQEKYGSIKDIFGVCAAAGLYNRRMLEEIREKTGYFDERFFFLVEDVDVALRAQQKGWRALFLPDIACRHYGNSSRTDRLARQYFCWRNRTFLLEKCPLKKYSRLLIWLMYDAPRVVWLVLSNKYVRAQLLHKKVFLQGVYT